MLALLSPALAWLLLVGYVRVSTGRYVYGSAQEVPAAPVAIVFGAGLKSDGQPTLILKDRLNGAIELIKEGKVQRLLMSGDNRVKNYNEPAAMREYAVQHGVPGSKIELDYAGRDTYDTCFRARHAFSVDKAVLVTQQYHAPRAVFIARGLGIDAVAYGVPNLASHQGLQLGYSGREYLADVKAWWDVELGHRKPYVGSK